MPAQSRLLSQRFADARDVRRAEWQRLIALTPYLRAHTPRVALAMAFLMAAKGASVLLPIALKHIVDGLDRSEHSAALVLPLGLLLAYGALRLASTLFGQIRDLVFGRVTERTMHQVALAVFSHLHRLDLEFHLSRRTGGLSRDIERGLGGIRFLLRFMLFNILPTAFEIGLVAAILFYYYSIWFTLIVLVSVVAYVAVTAALTEWRTRHVRESNRLDTAANTRAVDTLLNYETVKYFGNETFEADRYDAELGRWADAMARARRSLGVLNTLQALVIALAVTAMMILAGRRVVAGSMTLGDLTMVNAYMLQLFLPLSALGFVYRELKKAMADTARMFALTDIEPQITEATDARSLRTNQPEIVFDNVRFGYSSEREILRGVDLVARPGAKVAVVGHSGAGKSTLARLLFRFYDVDGRRDPYRRYRHPRTDAREPARRDRRRTAGHGAVQRHHRIQHCLRRAGSRRQTRDRARRAHGPSRRFHRAAAGRHGHAGRRAWPQALRRRETTHRHRPGHSQEPGDPRLRRSHVIARQRGRARDHQRAGRTRRRPHHAGDRPSAVHRGRRRPDRGARRRPRGRTGSSCRTAGRRRALCAHVAAATARRARGESDQDAAVSAADR